MKVEIYKDFMLPRTGGATISVVSQSDYEKLEDELQKLREFIKARFEVSKRYPKTITIKGDTHIRIHLLPPEITKILNDES